LGLVVIVQLWSVGVGRGVAQKSGERFGEA
jgi:hypothetical protein